MIVQLSANEPDKIKFPTRSLNWDWPAALLLLVCVLIGSGRLVVTRATDHLFLVAFLALLGCAAGLALGRSRFPAWFNTVLGLAYGAFFVPWQLGLAFFAGQEWPARMRDLAGRLGFAAGQFAAGENVEDPLLFVTAMAILFWLFGVNAGTRLARSGNVWAALIPFGLAVLVVQANDSREAWKAWLVAIFFLCALLLLARLQLLKHRASWETSGVYVPFELSPSITRLAFIFAAVMVVFAWATPTLGSTFNSIKSFWTEATFPWREEIGRALFPLQGGPGNSGNSFGEQLALGRGIPQSTQILFTVNTRAADLGPVRFYWRDRVYDQYEDGRWTSGYDARQTWEDLSAEQLAEYQGRSIADFEFVAQEGFELLHTVAQPVALDRPAEAAFASSEGGSLDVAALFALSPVVAGESYSVKGSLATPSAEQLRAAGSEYPAWVTERYLQLPVDISPQLTELAQTLAAGLATPYEIANAITDFLRAEIEYVDQLPVAPPDRDPIEWALFEQKQGFCNYYASAEVLMLRSLGIPARLAVGYAQGEREIVGDHSTYVVRRRDAHAWPEVYFPNIGWVEFEPTANQAVITRPTVSAEENLSEEELLRLLREELAGPQPPSGSVELPATVGIPEQVEPERNLNWLRPILASLALLALVLLLAWNWSRLQEGVRIPALIISGLNKFDLPVPQQVTRWARYSELSAIEKAYSEIGASLTRLGQAPKAGDTPQERSDSLARLLPELEADIKTLSQDYQFRLYSRSKISRDERALSIMNKIRGATRRERLRRGFEELIKLIKR